MQKQPRIVIIGGGFGGINAAKSLKKAKAEVILLDKKNHHLFQPLLYQVATAGLSPSDIAAPIRGVLHNQKNARVIMGDAKRIDRQGKRVVLEDGEIEYDYLVIATGMVNNYFGNREKWESHAPGLKTLEEATDIRRRLLLAFEAAEYTEDPDELAALLTFVVIGGGPTGVEMAGAIQEIAAEVMVRDFRNVDASQARVILIEGQDRLLTAFSEESSAAAKESLQNMGVDIVLNTYVKEINADGVLAGERFIPSKNAIWAAGLKAEPLVDSLGCEQDRAGRVHIESTLHVPEDPHVFVIGDVAHLEEEGRGMLPGVAQTAIQQGKHVAKNIQAHMQSKQMEPFSYFDKGQMATIGRAKAVAETNGLKMRGFIAWLAWLVVHLLFLIGFRSKVSVVTNWMYSYIATKRSTRLIINTEQSALGRAVLAHAPMQIEGSMGLTMDASAEDAEIIQDHLFGESLPGSTPPRKRVQAQEAPQPQGPA